MKSEQIKDGENLLAVVVRGADWADGLNFVSRDADFIQVGIWGYEKGKLLNPHIHLVQPRTALRTQEVVYVRSGRLRVNIFSEQSQPLTSFELAAGDTAILLEGGHGYEILEENTRVLEVKNGPYPGPDKDRRRL